MRHFTLLFAIFAVACGAQAQEHQPETEKTPWPIEPKSERVEHMLYLDNMNYELMGEPNEVDPAFAEIYSEIANESQDKIVNGILEVNAEAIEAWHKFVWLCNEGREKEAMEFYYEEHMVIDMALRHSLVRYSLHNDVIGYMAYEHLDPIKADELMMDVLGFDFAIICLTYTMGGDEYYLEVIDAICNILFTMYRDNERWDDMLNLYDMWLETTGYGEVYKDTLAGVNFSRANIYFHLKHDTETALKYLYEAKANAEEYFNDGGKDKEMKVLLKSVKKMIKEVEKQCKDL
ncbi:MAG: hypothetical protein IKW31_06270 [Alistipes sp.]|nr:hypothetical protein [Alistipes sp.]